MSRRASMISSNKKFASFLEKCRTSDERCAAGIESFMIIPVQRIPRYKLLLEELLKLLSPSAGDFEAIQRSLLKILEAAVEMNESIRQQVRKRAIVEVMMSIDSKYRINLLDNPDRRFLRSGFLKRQMRYGDKDFMFWLFSDKLLYGVNIGPWVHHASRSIEISHCYSVELRTIFASRIPILSLSSPL